MSDTTNEGTAPQPQSGIDIVKNVATAQQTQAADLKAAQDRIAALEHRLEQAEGVLAKADDFLHKISPEMATRLFDIVDKYFPHGA